MQLKKKYLIPVMAVIGIGTICAFYAVFDLRVEEVSVVPDVSASSAAENEKLSSDEVKIVNKTAPASQVSGSDESNREELIANENQVPVVLIHSEYSFNVGDPKELSKWAGNIFIAKVVRKIGEQPDARVPQTQYSANIISNIKGNAAGSIVINQAGVGYAEGKLFANAGDMVLPTAKTVDPDEIFLKEGGVYLFVVRHDEKNLWYTISAPPYDRELITADSSLSDSAALSRARENMKVQAYVNATRELGILSAGW
jgi:hypothetical protein